MQRILLQSTLKPAFSKAFPTLGLPSVIRSFHTNPLALNKIEKTNTEGSSITIDNKQFDLSPFKLIPKSNLYATIRIFNKPYLITAGDRLTLPHNLKDVDIGSVIKFNDVVSVGSRDFVFYPPNTEEAKKALESIINIEGTVIEKTKNRARTKLITKQRNRKNRRVLVKHKKTVLRISDINLQI